MSYRHDRRRKLIRRWQREGWQEIKGTDGRMFTAAPGTLPSVGALNYAAHMADLDRERDSDSPLYRY